MEDEHEVRGLYLKVYPPRWSDEFLSLLSAWGLKLHDHAPALGGWLDDLASAEQLRRLNAAAGRAIEVKPVVVPTAEWSNNQLAEALVAINALTYTTSDHFVGAFVDKVAMTINAAAAARLRRGT